MSEQWSFNQSTHPHDIAHMEDPGSLMGTHDMTHGLWNFIPKYNWASISSPKTQPTRGELITCSYRVRDPPTPEQHVDKQRHLREVDDKMSWFLRKKWRSQPWAGPNGKHNGFHGRKKWGSPIHRKESISFISLRTRVLAGHTLENLDLALGMLKIFHFFEPWKHLAPTDFWHISIFGKNSVSAWNKTYNNKKHLPGSARWFNSRPNLIPWDHDFNHWKEWRELTTPQEKVKWKLAELPGGKKIRPHVHLSGSLTVQNCSVEAPFPRRTSLGYFSLLWWVSRSSREGMLSVLGGCG